MSYVSLNIIRNKTRVPTIHRVRHRAGDRSGRVCCTGLWSRRHRFVHNYQHVAAALVCGNGAGLELAAQRDLQRHTVLGVRQGQRDSTTKERQQDQKMDEEEEERREIGVASKWEDVCWQWHNSSIEIIHSLGKFSHDCFGDSSAKEMSLQDQHCTIILPDIMTSAIQQTLSGSHSSVQSRKRIWVESRSFLPHWKGWAWQSPCPHW